MKLTEDFVPFAEMRESNEWFEKLTRYRISFSRMRTYFSNGNACSSRSSQIRRATLANDFLGERKC